MAKINILTPEIYNLIAAGEVVERPSSVVKELLENAIDAGAKNIKISIKDGGTTFIQVTDDGSGIEEEDFEAAFLPHATSKIADAADLEKILTLGFRGEALASISAVSKVTLISKTSTAETGTVLKISGGVFGEKSHQSFKVGTSITVEDLFYCVPARAKFLKKNMTGQQEVTSIVSRAILSHPDINFIYFIDDKQSLSSLGSTLKEAIFSVYGKEAVTETLEVFAEREGVCVSGFVGKPTFSKSNRTYQTLIVNGRYVINLTVQMAVSNAFGDFLMKRQYPFFVLNLNIPKGEVDCNIHPNKLDVKFLKSNLVYSVVFEAVSRALHEMDYVKEIELSGNGERFGALSTKFSGESTHAGNARGFGEGFGGQGSPLSSSLSGRANKLKEIDKAGVNLNPFSADYSNLDSTERDKITDAVVDAVLEGKIDENVRDNFGLGSKLLERINRKFQEGDKKAFISSDYIDDDNPENSNITGANSALAGDGSTFINSDGSTSAGGGFDSALQGAGSSAYNPSENENSHGKYKKSKVIQEDFAKDEFRVVGKIFNTYLVIEWGNNVYIFDQHAAHERLRYEKLKAEYESGEVVVQPMLVPFVITLNPQDDQIINENLDVIRSVGFDIAEFGERSYKISAVPAIVSEIDFNRFFGMFLEEKLGKQKITDAELIKDSLMQMACKSAVKGGDDLTKSEMEYLFLQMSKNNMILFCPHGRPVVVRITKTEIEKWFKRII